jgi:hypothetical protein
MVDRGATLVSVTVTCPVDTTLNRCVTEPVWVTDEEKVSVVTAGADGEVGVIVFLLHAVNARSAAAATP